MTELAIVILTGIILAAMAIPAVSNGLARMRVNSAASAASAAISNTRYRAIMNSQVYTVAITTPANTYVATNVTTGTADSVVPLSSGNVALNGGGSATYTFTLCPNGTVYGAGGACPGSNTPPGLAFTYSGTEVDISVSSAGNVTTKTIH